jgi:hypothetical protein
MTRRSVDATLEAIRREARTQERCRIVRRLESVPCSRQERALVAKLVAAVLERVKT